jgi:hypothetical protein
MHRDENGKVPPDGQTQAMKDIDTVMNTYIYRYNPLFYPF